MTAGTSATTERPCLALSFLIVSYLARKGLECFPALHTGDFHGLWHRVVFPCMPTLLAHLQIVRRVVGGIAIKVVCNLIGCQLPTQLLLEHFPMNPHSHSPTIRVLIFVQQVTVLRTPVGTIPLRFHDQRLPGILEGVNHGASTNSATSANTQSIER